MSDTSAPDPRTSLAQERTGLATFRTSLALDRNTLAWIRTTLSMTSFGLGMIGFFRSLRQQNENAATIRMHQGAIHFGLALSIIGIVVTVFVIFSHRQTLQRLLRDETPVLSLWPMSILLAMLLTLLSMYGLWVVLGY